MMKVKYIGTDEPLSLTYGRVYDVEEVVFPFGEKLPIYQMVDDVGDSACYPWCDFVVVDGFDIAERHGIPSDPRTVVK